MPASPTLRLGPGVEDFDAGAGGLGECPYAPGATGNTASEELVHLKEDMGVATGVGLEAVIDMARSGRARGRAHPAFAGAAGGPQEPDDPRLIMP